MMSINNSQCTRVDINLSEVISYEKNSTPWGIGWNVTEIASPKVNKMPMIIIEELCKGCAACVEVCPSKAISRFIKTAKIDRELCQDCEKCLFVCPNGAITGAPRNGMKRR
jgi:NAD-dependent dihydropyrimidine dehydrogenase PreA subunit